MITNADHIRNMTDEELAEYITTSPDIEFGVCVYCKYGNSVPDDEGQCLSPQGCCYAEERNKAFIKWLRQPVDEMDY